MDQANRRQYSKNNPGYANAVDEATLFGVTRTLVLGAGSGPAGDLATSVPVPAGCNRVLVKALVTGGAAGVLTVLHCQNRENSAGVALSVPLGAIAYAAAGASAVYEIPPGSGYIATTVAGLAGGQMDAEAIFWRQSP